MMGVECTYDNNKNETHLSIFLIMISGTAFHWGLWPAYGWYTPLIMIAMSYGVVLQVSERATIGQVCQVAIHQSRHLFFVLRFALGQCLADKTTRIIHPFFRS